MSKSNLTKTLESLILKELDGVQSIQAKNTRRQALQATIKDLKQRLVDTQTELNNLR